MSEALVLRGYQDDIMDLLRSGFAAGHRSQMLYAPTGAGKTEIAVAILKATSEKYKRGAMVLDRIVLCNQTSARLQKYGIDHGVMQSGHWRYRPYERVQVCSAQTLEKRGSFPGLNLLIVDEAHDMRRQTLKFIKENPDIKVIGLSATPFSNGLGQTYTNVVSATTTEKLVTAGSLVPLRVFISKEVDMSGAKKMAGEWSIDTAGERGIKITGDVVTEWTKKTMEIYGRPVKTIVFASNVAHGADLANKFAEAGYNFVAISYKDDDQYKADVMADFAKPDTKVVGLIACSLLTKGYDEPSVLMGISARPYSKSFKSHVQEMGRVMRPHAGKEFATWLDHSGNYLRFLEDWDELYHDGVTELKDGKEKAKKEKTDLEKKQAKCPACGALWIGRSDNCVSCGYHRPMQSLVQAVPGEMEELKGAAKKEDKQRWYSELLDMQGTKSSGWVAHKYKEKFGVWPRGLNDVAIPASLEVRRWVTSRQIAWAKSRKAA
jgi:superfamily II DNA or RNA helicase